MFGLGPAELIIIAVIIFLLFGARRLPEIGKGLGGAIREFKNVKKEISGDSGGGKSEKDTAAAPAAGNGTAPSKLEEKVVGKVLDQVPGVKKVMSVKKKADRIKEIIG